METKKSKTGGIIGTLVAVFLCGCPGLCVCLWGVLAATGNATGNFDVGSYTGSGPLPTWAGYVAMCGSVFLILIPIVVGLMTLRDKKPKAVPPASNEPLPPAS